MNSWESLTTEYTEEERFCLSRFRVAGVFRGLEYEWFKGEVSLAAVMGVQEGFAP